MASQLLAALAEPLVIEDQPLDIGASMGIALFPDHGKDGPTLLRCADVAMYVAKRGRKGVSVYESNQDQYTPRRLALMGELRRAIAQNALKLYYQPKVSPSTGRIHGVEALIRWPHPEYSFIQPDHFIPPAEHTNLIGPLTDWVLETAIDQCGTWGRKDLELDVVINMSMRILHDGTLPARISRILQKHDVAPGLHGLGCDMAQGYYIARALPVLELEQWIFTSPWGLPRDTAEISA